MKKLLPPLCSLLLPILAHASDNTLTSEEKDAGWQLLFDGNDPSLHWRAYKQNTFPQTWTVADGTLFRQASGGDIVTRETFENFELELDWKISPKGNSGVMFRVQETMDAPWKTGPEIQILDKAAPDPNKAGWLYALYPSAVDACHPTGDWNHIRFVTKNGKCEHWLNGVKYLEYQIGSEDWKAKVAASKFAQFPDFAANARGRICLQDHGNPVWFKNIRIRPL